jgi:NAD(P)-dependent dehydrogenase (short-subunit alcohol dehydrogenase family)
VTCRPARSARRGRWDGHVRPLGDGVDRIIVCERGTPPAGAPNRPAWQVSEEEILRRFQAKIPLGRYSTPEEVAGLVAYLATDTAASITAQAINVCGGLGNF